MRQSTESVHRLLPGLRRRSRLRFRRPAALAALALAVLAGCMTGSEVPNELTGILVTPDGSPQADVRVSLFASDAVPGPDSAPVAMVRTDARGRYRFRNLAEGTYNALAEKAGSRAFRDSMSVTDRAGFDAGTDTLKAPGALIGRIRLEPLDSPRLALVQVIGTDIYVNVDSSGRFALTHMAEGVYRIRVAVADPDSYYIPEFRVVEIVSGRTDTLAEVIEPFYIGPPRPSGIRAEALTDGSIRVTWNRTRSKDPFTYALFREASDANVMSGNALRYFLTDTVYLDTVYSRTPRPDPYGFQPTGMSAGVYGGQYPWEDTVAYQFRYYIIIFMDNSTANSPRSPMVHVTAIPPTVPR